MNPRCRAGNGGPQRQASATMGLALATSVVLLLAPGAMAAYDIAQQPLYLGGVIEPNLMYLHDDSGSMSWGYLPDSVSGARLTRRGHSSAFNRQYYDPEVRYLPPLDHEGNSLGNANFQAAWVNGYAVDRDQQRTDLRSAFRHSWTWGQGSSDVTGTPGAFSWSGPASGEPAYYYRFDASAADCDGTLTDDNCYLKVIVGETSGPALTDLNGDGRLSEADRDERGNFANWYSYHRIRNFSARAGISRAFASLGEGIRVGYGRINETAGVIDGKAVTGVTMGVRPFAGDARRQFYDWLFSTPTSGNTPLRRALYGAGSYFENESDLGPWSTTPGESGGQLLSCRKSFTVLMTDGYWNDAAAGAVGRDNHDGTPGASIVGPDGERFTYLPRAPFADLHRDTLADVAMHFWKRDLLPDIDNRVPVSPQNPAFWQHMVTFGVSLGMEGTVNPETAFNAIASGDAISWGNPVTATADSPYKIDDLMHAALNSRGGFYSAGDAQELSVALRSALARIQSQNTSASQIAVSGTQVEGGSRVFQARFDSSAWSGQLLAFKVYSHEDLAAGAIPHGSAVGEIAARPLWDAGQHIPAPDQRRILSWDPEEGRGVEFRAGEGGLSEVQWQRLYDDPEQEPDSVEARRSALLAYLRGERGMEVAVSAFVAGEAFDGFRQRESVLGDIVNSDPVFVASADFGYGSASHPQLRTRRADYLARRESPRFRERPQMVYVGANDGMLHGFDAHSGRERLAFVPDAVIDHLHHLAEPLYAHRYYVDGAPTVADAWVGGAGAGWKTVLVGSTGAGGRSYFALDVDDPRDGAEGGAIQPGLVMWEFSDPELGYSIGQASIGMTESGNWVAIFGNGYNSEQQRAQLFVVDLASGDLLARLDTGSGSAEAPNGLATPVVIDADGNGAIDLVYAGDLHGQLWKFDFTGAHSSAWKIGFSGEPLFRASDDEGRPQAITSRPQVARHPSRGGLLLAFGTGQFFVNGDQSNRALQSFYGVLDLCGRDSSVCPRALSRSRLRQQHILSERAETFGELSWQVRVLSDHRVGDDEYGYFLDLRSPRNGLEGERIISSPLIWNDRVIYTTMIPSADPCLFGGSSWVMEVDPFHGGRLDFAVFDMDEDGRYDHADFVTLRAADGSESRVAVSGRRTRSGVTRTPAVIDGQKYISSGSSEAPEILRQFQLRGRQSWRQLR